MIYTDGTHLIGTTLGELHAFAQGIGLKREWFQERARHPHYDLTSKRMTKRALSHGAELVSTRQLILKLRCIKEQRRGADEPDSRAWVMGEYVTTVQG